MLAVLEESSLHPKDLNRSDHIPFNQVTRSKPGETEKLMSGWQLGTSHTAVDSFKQ